MQKIHLTFIVIVAAIGGFLFGYNTSVVAGALLFIREEIPLTLGAQSLTVSSAIFGAFAGVLLGGQLADRIGRRKTMLIGAFFILFGGIFLLFASSLLGLLMGRVIVGVGMGLASLNGPLYIAEVVPGKNRGAYVAFFQVAITIGILNGYLSSYFFAESAGWRVVFGLTSIPALIQFIALLACPDSPSFLLAKGRGAKRALKSLGREEEHEKIEKEIRQALSESGGVCWKDLFQKPLLLALTAGVGMALLVQFTGINTVIHYAPHLFQISGFPNGSDAMAAALGIGIANLLATLIALFFLDKWGRKPLLYIGLTGMCSTLITLAVSLFVNAQTMPLLTAVNLILYVAFFSIGIGPVAWVIISEVFPLRIRGRAMSLSLATSWIANLFVSSSFLHMIEAISLSGTFLLYGIVTIIGIFFVYRFVPETKGKTLEEIEAEYGKGRN
ncbi:MAG: sugar porter family MFS transporter [Candidatus Algichlamydia australiensis]|nr:sugar porter family MFS transporter [Chlamydiales bacterium]